MVFESVKRINELVKRMSILEESIAIETEYIKEVYAKASKSMSDSQHYFKWCTSFARHKILFID